MRPSVLLQAIPIIIGTIGNKIMYSWNSKKVVVRVLIVFVDVIFDLSLILMHFQIEMWPFYVYDNF